MFVNALKMADNPTPNGPEKYYDFWDEWTNSDNNGTHLEPEIALVGAGSDQAPFAFYANIPVTYLEFGVDEKKYPGLDKLTYPMYHSEFVYISQFLLILFTFFCLLFSAGYETFYLMDNLVDPGFKIHKTCTQVLDITSSLFRNEKFMLDEMLYNAINFHVILDISTYVIGIGRLSYFTI